MSGKMHDPEARRQDGGKASPAQAGRGPQSREERLKAALKANMARRKAQSKARAAREAGPEAEQ